MNRRSFLGTMAWAAAGLSAQQVQTFPQSVASGDPSPNGIVLWTRVDPAVQGGPSPYQVAYDIATTPDFSHIPISGTATLDMPGQPGKDNTVKVVVSDNRLQPFTTYYYRFLYNSVYSRTGRFKTLPAAGANLPELRLGYVVCQDYGNGYYTALQFLAQEEVDYVIHLGDYIYETITSASFQSNPARTVPPFPSGNNNTIPVNVDDYRHLYKVYRSDPNQQAVHERFAYIQLWDDHEFANDWIATRIIIPTTTAVPIQQQRRNRHCDRRRIKRGLNTDSRMCRLLRPILRIGRPRCAFTGNSASAPWLT